MSEQWRPIPGFPGYEASDQGRIRSHLKYRGQSGPRVLRPTPVKDGYLEVHLRAADGRDPVVKVHVLVMLAFVGERPADQVIRHLDGAGTNNALGNLCYGSPSQNSFDQVRHGTHPFARRTHCKHGHEYTPENTAIWTSSKGRPFRQCIACRRARQQRRDGRSAA